MGKMINTAYRERHIILICSLCVALGFSLAANFFSNTHPAIAADNRPAVSDWRTAFEDTAAKLEPSVVYIKTEKQVEVSQGMPDIGELFNFGPFNIPKRAPEKQKSTASGSGVIVRSDGYIMTNNHVVAGADRVVVHLSDGRELKGKVFLDPLTDLALVKIEAKNLPAAQFADSDKVKVGQWTMAIGNPFGLQNTVTVGVVSAMRKEVDPENPLPYPEVIQTDASINPGNSGGPLVNLNGEIIGINGAIYSTSGGNMGIGFAIPSNTVKWVMSQLIEKGKVTRGFLGIEMSDMTPSMAQNLGVTHGALVTNVTKDSAASKGGVQVKDVVIKVNAYKIDNAADLRHTVEKIAPNTPVKVVVVRDKKEVALTVTLMERTASDDDEIASDNSSDKTGLSVQPLTADLANRLEIDPDIKGVVVRGVEPGTPASRARIKEGDVITEIDNVPVTSVATYAKAAKNLKSGDTVIVVIQRGNRSLVLEMNID